ncbi:MAG: DUF2141 domain-containing protein [Bacteroidales bacterium]|nr:DUF2141 domain-containing protein [Bacteroidales bacterium]
MKKLIVGIAIFLSSGIAFAQNGLTLEITGIKKDGGKLHISFFNSEKSYDGRKIYYSIIANSIAETLSMPITLPAGGYVISMYQDKNGNGELDSNFLGIPREPFGFSNYAGKSAPGSFDKLKVIVNDTTKTITVHLYKI